LPHLITVNTQLSTFNEAENLMLTPY